MDLAATMGGVATDAGSRKSRVYLWEYPVWFEMTDFGAIENVFVVSLQANGDRNE